MRFLRNGREYIRYLEQNNLVPPLSLGHEDEQREDDDFDDVETMADDGSGNDVTGRALNRVCHVNRPHTTAEGAKRVYRGARSFSFFSARGKSGNSSGFVEFKVCKIETKKKTLVWTELHHISW